MEANTQYNVNRFILFKAPWLPSNREAIKLGIKAGETGRVTANSVRVRTGPGESYIAVKTLSKDDLVSIIDKQGEWFEIAEGEWIHSKQVEVSFAARVEKLYTETKVVSTDDDLQKGRWGGAPAANGWELKAGVTKDNLPTSYNVALNVSTKNTNATGEVAFFLHDSFSEQIRYEQIIKGKAQLNVTAYEAFTVGAYTEDGTMLELDLNGQEGFPNGFYYDEVADNFKQKVEEMYRNKEVLVKNDIQKNRWGGKSIDKGKELSATVTKSMIPLNYKVEITVSPENKDRPFNGDVAFFLHDSFLKKIRYKKARNGMAKITVTAYEDFTVGAYTDDGAMLELDLHEIKGFPQGFYSKK